MIGLGLGLNVRSSRLGGIAPPPSPSAPFTIDAFTSGAASGFRPEGTTNYSDTDAGIFGGSRDVRVFVASGAGGGFAGISAGRYTLQVFGNAALRSHSARFRYDGVANVPASPPNVTDILVNLTTLTAARVEIFSQTNISNPSALTVTLYDSAGVSASVAISLPVGATGVVNYDFALSGFTGIDLSRIGAIELLIGASNITTALSVTTESFSFI